MGQEKKRKRSQKKICKGKMGSGTDIAESKKKKDEISHEQVDGNSQRRQDMMPADQLWFFIIAWKHADKRGL